MFSLSLSISLSHSLSLSLYLSLSHSLSLSLSLSISLQSLCYVITLVLQAFIILTSDSHVYVRLFDSYLFRPVADNPYLKSYDEDEIVSTEGSIEMEDKA